MSFFDVCRILKTMYINFDVAHSFSLLHLVFTCSSEIARLCHEMHDFYKKKVYKKLAKILIKLRGSISRMKCFYWPKTNILSSLPSNYKDGI